MVDPARAGQSMAIVHIYITRFYKKRGLSAMNYEL